MQQDPSQKQELPLRLATQGGSLILTESGIRIEDNGQQEWKYADLIGFACQAVSPGQYKLQLNCFSRVKRLLRAPRREISQVTHMLHISAADEKCMEEELLSRITNRPSTAPRCLLIYFNPHAGSNSRQHLQKVLQFFTLTNFTYQLVETTHRGHCKEHLGTIDPLRYSAVVIISGDGLMHQFVNSPVATKVPVTHVPAGSGNAFAKTQTTMAGEDCNDETAIFLAVKGRTTRMNLIKMQLQKEPQPIYSFLSLEWAFLADIDMNSEFLRVLGGLRFEVYSAYRCVALKRYAGKLTYSQTQTQLPPLNQPITNPAFVSIESNFLNAIFCSIPYISDKYEFAPLLKVEDRAIDMQFTTQEQGRMQLVKYLLATEKGDHFDRAKGCKKEGYNFGNAKIKSYRLQPQGNEQSKGLFGIDGECYQAQCIQVSVTDKDIITFV